ncbi:M28 family peptidase [uncultured Muribaculum sp.]|uniref:M28 family peptidase n=1 Tax=uncultured Muribaculum sp. TaxID=1918613 RepID=UPI00261EC89E|nr:M28 family peptidase [uncultured Muribaculum sp.]
MKSLHFAIFILAMFIAGCKSGKKQSTVEVIEAPATIDIVNFNADSAYKYVKTQVDFGPRVPGSTGHAACADYLINSLSRYGADTVIVQRAALKNYLDGDMPIINIMGRYGVDKPERVLLVAHWDTRPWADSDPNIENRARAVPGANDGASGVGVLLEIARQMSAKRPDVGVDILFVDGEDSGRSDGWGASEETWCIGTQYWIKNMPYTQSTLPRYGILLDMVGGIDATFPREYVSDYYARAINDKVWSMASASGYGKVFSNDQRGGLIDDHTFINRAGIPCIDIIECGHPETGTFSPVWHTVNDDMEHIGKSTLKAVGQTVANVIYHEKAE